MSDTVKPEGVSQEVWNTSSRIAMTGAVHRMDALAMSAHIARAITAAVAAEREACALLAFFTDVPNETAMKISAAIRARSRP